jgi:adenylate cyclase, class 2
VTAVESEIKLRVADAESARAALRRAGATLARPRHFEDNVLLDDPAGSLRARGALLRVRRVDENGVVTYKGPREIVEGVKSRPEIETALADPDAAESIFAALGYQPVFRYQKYREVYALDDVEVVVDETPIGTFLEVEGEIDAIHRAAVALGYGPADYVADSYATLFFAAGGQGDMVFRPER